MANIFSLFGTIFIDNEQANKNIDNTTKKGESAGSKVGNAFKAIGKAAAVMGTATVAAATTVGTAAYKMATDTAEQADYIDKLSERTGINREELQRWKHAADQSGVSVDSFQNGVKKMTDVIDSANQGSKSAATALNRLGLSLDDLNGMTTEEQFDAITAALADMEQGAERNALGNDLLGKSYTEMLPLLNQGKDGMQALKDEADELGLVMSESTVKSGVKLKDTVSNVKSAFNGFKNQIGSAAIPIIQKFADTIIDNLPKIQKMIDDIMPILISIFDTVVPPLFDLAETIFPILLSLIEMLLPPLQEIIAAILPLIVQVLEQLMPPLMELLEALLPPLIDLLMALLPILQPLLDLTLALVVPSVELATKILPVIIEVLAALVDAIVTNVTPTIEALKEIVDYFAEELISWVNRIIDKLKAFVNYFVDDFGKDWKDGWNSVKSFFVNTLNTIKGKASSILKSVFVLILRCKIF